MSDWKAHDGKGVPPDAILGVTECYGVAPPNRQFAGGSFEVVVVWMGGWSEWDWAEADTLGLGKIIKYRNPSQAAVDALKAIAADPKRKFRKLVKA